MERAGKSGLLLPIDAAAHAIALQLAHKPSTSPEQQQRAMAMIRKPAVDAERFRRVWEGEVYALADAYEMAE
jgi:acyl-CoA dehydrogenase